jgi:selenocysteine-specific elongation factor
VRGDRYILRRPSPGETLGGGAVIEPHPKRRHKRFDESVIKNLASLAQGSPAEVLLQAALALGAAPVKDVLARSRLEGQAAESALKELLETGQLAALDELVMAAAQWSALHENAVAAVDTYHKSFPLRRGMPREELKSKLKLPPRVFNPFIASLVARRSLLENGALVASPDHEIKFDAQQQAAIKRLTARFAAAPFAPPTVKECQAEVGEEVFAALLELDEMLAVSEDVVFRKNDYEGMVAKIRQSIQEKGRITVADVRDLFDTTRRYALALMEHLDAAGMTVREGDARRLKK